MTQHSPQPLIELDLTGLIEEFRAARGAESDVEWLRTVAGRLMLDDVKLSTAKEALIKLLPVLRDAQEPAEDLFGDPKVWAKDQQERWQQSGTPAYDRHELLSTGQFTQAVCFSATLIAVAVTIVALIDDGWTAPLSWMMFALPFFLAAATIGLVQVWNLAVRKFTRLMAMVWTAVTLIVGTLALSGLTVLMQGSAGTGSVFWYLAPAPLYVLFHYAIGVVLKRKPKTVMHLAPVAATTQDEWVGELQGNLRLRGDLSDRRIRVIVNETRAYAAEAEASLHEEFGTPASYAASFTPNASYRARRAAWAWTAGSTLIAALILVSILNAQSFLTWQTAIFAALLIGTACYAVQSWRASFKNQ
ncbi:hypothetical protein ACT3UA_15260 [Glutamicibacter sp. 363]|uniref:hypothetical protein n=1 Tax=Glutamicibacter sp. 363 TaxID=3457731 RepID=UPI004033D01D